MKINKDVINICLGRHMISASNAHTMKIRSKNMSHQSLNMSKTRCQLKPTITAVMRTVSRIAMIGYANSHDAFRIHLLPRFSSPTGRFTPGQLEPKILQQPIIKALSREFGVDYHLSLWNDEPSSKDITLPL